MASCTTTVTDGMVVRTQETSEGRRQGAAGVSWNCCSSTTLWTARSATRAASARCRTRRCPPVAPKPGSPMSNARSPNRSACRRRCCWTVSAACCAPGAPASPTRSPATRSSNCWNAVRCNSRHRPRGEFRLYFSGNTVQICPVGALTGTAYRFRARRSTWSPPQCVRALRIGLRTAHRPPPRRGAAPAGRRRPRGQRGVELRQGPLGLHLHPGRRPHHHPLVRDDDGQLRSASWPEAIGRRPPGWPTAAAGARGGRSTVEDAYAYAKFARIVLRTNDIDFRSRPHSAEEADFLTARVAGQSGVSYAALGSASMVVLAGFEPEDESPIVFLRLRKAVRTRGLPIVTIAPFASRGRPSSTPGSSPPCPG